LAISPYFLGIHHGFSGNFVTHNLNHGPSRSNASLVAKATDSIQFRSLKKEVFGPLSQGVFDSPCRAFLPAAAAKTACPEMPLVVIPSWFTVGLIPFPDGMKPIQPHDFRRFHSPGGFTGKSAG
jgi:hypothetical protein